MATIQNERDKLLQAAPVRVIPPEPLQIGDIVGLPDRLDAIDGDIEALGDEVSHLMTNTADLAIRASALSMTSAETVTLTAMRKNGLTGTVTWSLFSGSATLTPSGDACTISGASVYSQSVTVKAAIGPKEAYVTLTKLGALAMQNSVNLANQVTGALASGNITGLGALAHLNAVNANTQIIGALNGLTQVTNLGTLAYANGLYADQIGAGQLAAGVVYTGSLYASQITAGTFSADRISGGTISSSDVTTSNVWATTVLAMRVSGHNYFQCDPITGAGFNARIANPGLVIGNENGPQMRIVPNTHISASHPSGTICFHPTYGLMFVKDGVRYVCSTTPLS